MRWVKIENCEYQIGDEEITQWMRLYGQPLSLLGEDVLPDSDSDGGDPVNYLCDLVKILFIFRSGCLLYRTKTTCGDRDWSSSD